MTRIFIIITILISALAYSTYSHAQESIINLRNGKKVAVRKCMPDSADYYEGKLNYITLKGKNKEKYLEDVFSVVDGNGNETVLYKQNIEFGELLTPEEMKQYTLGLSDAREASISPLIGIGGVVSGLAGAFIPQPEISFGESTMEIPVGILLPATYVGIMGATPPNADKLKERLPAQANNEKYLMGYQEGQKKKRIKESLIGAGFGFIVGILVYNTVN